VQITVPIFPTNFKMKSCHQHIRLLNTEFLCLVGESVCNDGNYLTDTGFKINFHDVVTGSSHSNPV
jgi:hypothetical protein